LKGALALSGDKVGEAWQYLHFINRSRLNEGDEVVDRPRCILATAEQ